MVNINEVVEKVGVDLRWGRGGGGGGGAGASRRGIFLRNPPRGGEALVPFPCSGGGPKPSSTLRRVITVRSTIQYIYSVYRVCTPYSKATSGPQPVPSRPLDNCVLQ